MPSRFKHAHKVAWLLLITGLSISRSISGTASIMRVFVQLRK
jgi:hypothetical protein